MKQDGVFKKVKSHSGGLELFFIYNPSKVPDFRGGVGYLMMWERSGTPKGFNGSFVPNC